MIQIAKGLVRSHHGARDAFEHYGHILYFVPIAFDHFHDTLGITALIFIAYYAVSAVVAFAHRG